MRSIWILALLIPFFSTSQEAPERDTLRTLDLSSNMVRTDNTGHIYLATRDQLMKLDKEGDTMFVASNKLFGEITDLDVTFALKPIVFLQDQNMVSILDNTLNPQGAPIILDDHEIYQPQVVCSSYSSNSIWVFNKDNSELIKLDAEQGIVFRSGNLEQLTGIEVNANDMHEFGNKLYLNNPDYGVMVFDIFGTYHRMVPIKGAEYFQVFDKRIVYKKDNALWLYDLMALTHNILMELPDASGWAELNAKKLFYTDFKKLYVLGL